MTRKKPGNRKQRKRAFFVFLAVAFMLTWLGFIFVLFPLGNPLNVVGGTMGEGIVYAVLFGVIITFFWLIYYSTKSTLWDLLCAFGDDLGIDVDEIWKEYKKIIREEYLVFTGKTDRKSDNHDDEHTEDGGK